MFSLLLVTSGQQTITDKPLTVIDPLPRNTKTTCDAATPGESVTVFTPGDKVPL